VSAYEFLLVAVAAAGAWLVLPPLARFAHARGWVDPHPREAVPARKRGQRPSPRIGGVVVLAAALAAAASGVRELPAPVLATLVLAFAAGWLDDRRPGGFRPRGKLALQFAAVAPLVVYVGAALCRPAEDGDASLVAALRDLLASPPGWHCGAAGGLAVLALALVCFNVVNTWDHADGVVATFVAVVFAAAGAPLVAGAGAGLLARQLAPGREGRPFLGDAGSHLVGALVLVTPAAWPFLWLPALDLVRVVAMRVADGQHPFEGDRRHLGAALQARGLSPTGLAALQAAVLATTAILLGGL
jgi:UDP-N-acetylmuramyl pentapeptide phosphotransferase/UDP-N-acetylglucosamine-1-phosphate transferase